MTPTRIRAWLNRPLVEPLVRQLGPTLVAVATGGAHRRLNVALHWLAGHLRPTRDERRKLIALRVAFDMVSAVDGPDVARMWLIGTNPDLGDEVPVIALRDGRLLDVLIAACRYAEENR